MKPPVLLCYNLEGETRRKIRLLAMRMTIRVRNVEPEEYGQTLAALCGLESAEPAPPPVEPFTQKMLVLAHFPADLLNRFLYGFRKDGIPPVELKAILTDSNIRWSSATLYGQLKEEHEALNNRQAPIHQPEDR